MRTRNSVGGYRVYPTSPADAEAAEHNIAVLGRFNEGMDRLNRERQLTEQEQHQVDHLDQNSQLGNYYQRLIAMSDNLWTLGLEKQRNPDDELVAGRYTVNQLTILLNQCADRWLDIKRRLDE